MVSGAMHQIEMHLLNSLMPMSSTAGHFDYNVCNLHGYPRSSDSERTGFVIHPGKGWLGASTSARVTDSSASAAREIAGFNCWYIKVDVNTYLPPFRLFFIVTSILLHLRNFRHHLKMMGMPHVCKFLNFSTSVSSGSVLVSCQSGLFLCAVWHLQVAVLR